MRVVFRTDEYVVDPGPVEGDSTDIAFAGSAILDGDAVHLYYTVSDSVLMRSLVGVSD
jgi:predicted GH43/DUF377 family glycosyl hydrolase